MNYQLKGFSFSLVIHISVLFIIIAMSSSMVRLSKPVVIDFNIEGSSVKGAPKTAPEPEKRELIRHHEVKPVEPKKPEVKQEVKPFEKSAVLPAMYEDQAPVPEPVTSRTSKEVYDAGAQRRPNISSAESGAVKTGPDVASAGGSIESARQRYMKEHFAYIRDTIQQKIIYPGIARKMGWMGKVVISFVVSFDGCVKDLKIAESSGIKILDKNAIDTVSKASPFPRPPVEAQLIIPINYSLN